MSDKKPISRKRKLSKIKLPTMALKTHKKDSSKIAGSVERLNALTRRTLQLKMEGYAYYEISDLLYREFGLEAVPPIATVASWVSRAYKAYNEDIEALKVQMRSDQFNQLERMKRKYLIVACADEMEIVRWVREEGVLQPTIDENAIAEQMEAAKIVIAIMNRQARLLGIDLQEAAPKDGEGPQSLQELQLWIVNQVSNQPPTTQPAGKSVEIEAEVLSLETGLPPDDKESV